VIEALETQGKREKYKVMIGGEAVTQAWAEHPARSVETDSLLPYDHRFHAEIGLAATKYTRKAAEPLAQKMYAKYEKLIKAPTQGFRYEEVYDLKTRKIINEEYLKTQDEVRAEFKEIGFEVFRS